MASLQKKTTNIMARTTEQIKASLETEWMNNPTIASLYGFTPGAQFARTFPAASIESLLLYIVAYCAHVVESAADAVKSDIDATLREMVPHRLRWYAAKALAWQKGYTLPEGSDTYADTMSDEAAEARVVTHAVAVEDASGNVTVKVAKDDGGSLAPLDADERTQLLAYMAEVKDAGVRLSVISQEGDGIHVNATVYYDPQRTSSDVRNDIITAVRECVEALPFNGELTAMAIEDAMQNVDGVKVVNACAIADANDGRVTPAAGWFKWTDESLTITLTPYA